MGIQQSRLSPSRDHRGSVLLFLVIGMVIFSVMGAVMVSLFGTSIFGVATSNQARKAQYAAESGLRYVVSQIKNSNMADTECSTCPTKDTVCCVKKKVDAMYTDTAYNTAVEYTLGTSPEKFQVRAYPYWFHVVGTAATQNTTSNLAASIRWNGFAPTSGGGQFTIPAGARLQVGANPPVAINIANTNSSIAADGRSITFNLASSVFVPNGQTVNASLVFATVNSDQAVTRQPLSSFDVNTSSTDIMPPTRGTFIYDGKAFLYDRALVNTGVNPNTVTLSGIRWTGNPSSVTIRSGSNITFVENTRLVATGSYGTTGVQKAMTEYSDLGGSPDAAASSKPPQSSQPVTATFSNNDLTSLDLTRSADRVIVQGYIATGGTHQYWAAFRKLGTTYAVVDPENMFRLIGYHVVPIAAAYRNTLKASYLQYGQLSYDVQVKAGWDLNLPYAASGISFRWHEAPGFPGKYQGYGASFMRFDSKHLFNNDYIPNTVKPGSGDSARQKLLLVLWEQRVDTAGIERKRWLAYAVLGELGAGRCDQSGNTKDPLTGTRHPADPDQKVTGCQGWPDGAVNDNATIMVRVEDKFVGSRTRVNEIKLFYGDASQKFQASGERAADGVATNVARYQYCAEWMGTNPPCYSGVHFNPPRWPSNVFDVDGSTSVIAYWNASKAPVARSGLSFYDFFTMGSASPKNPFNDVILVKNPALDDIFLLDDQATIRTGNFRPDSSFPIPQPGTFTLDSFDNDAGGNIRAEIGLHAMGDLNDSNHTVAFDDLAAQILGVVEQTMQP